MSPKAGFPDILPNIHGPPFEDASSCRRKIRLLLSFSPALCRSAAAKFERWLSVIALLNAFGPFTVILQVVLQPPAKETKPTASSRVLRYCIISYVPFTGYCRGLVGYSTALPSSFEEVGSAPADRSYPSAGTTTFPASLSSLRTLERAFLALVIDTG